MSRTIPTISINARRMALMSVIMMPKSIACISSRISIWCTQKLEISQNALKTRCAPHPFQTSSEWVELGPGRWKEPTSPNSTTGSSLPPRKISGYPHQKQLFQLPFAFFRLFSIQHRHLTENHSFLHNDDDMHTIPRQTACHAYKQVICNMCISISQNCIHIYYV